MRFYWSILFFLLVTFAEAQQLQPGFDRDEFIELLRVNAHQVDRAHRRNMAGPTRYQRAYTSAVVGLDNKWELWTNKKGVAVISIRGTTRSTASWLENFYAAMVPAAGKLTLNSSTNFQYQLSENPKAAVHVGWLVGMAYLAQDILPKMDSCYKAGIKDFVILGHSQGGAISYLLTSHLYNLQKRNLLPTDIRIKTYCSAAPKPGNLYYAYDYEATTQSGWAFNVVNSADWVPETPVSIQTLHDFNNTNPFGDAQSMFRKQPFPKNLAISYVFNRLNKPTLKAQRKYQKYLGKMAHQFVKQNLQEYEGPVFYNSNNYVRTGAMVVLRADEDYYKLFPDDKEKVFVHHNYDAYLYLAQKLTGSSSVQAQESGRRTD